MGYSTVRFTWITDETSNATNGTTLYNYNTSKKNAEKYDGTNNHWFYKTNTKDAWQVKDISLSQVAENCAVMFDYSGTRLYIAGVQFLGSTQKSLDGNFASEAYWNAWGYTGVTGATTFNAELNDETGVMQVETTGSNNVIYLSSGLITAAKNAGKTYLRISYTASATAGIYEYSGSGALVYNATPRLCYSDALNGGWYRYTIRLSDVGENKGVAIGMVNSTTVGLKDVYFMGTAATSIDYNANIATQRNAWIEVANGKNISMDVAYNQTLGNRTGVITLEASGSTFGSSFAMVLDASIIARAKELGKTQISFAAKTSGRIPCYVYGGTGNLVLNTTQSSWVYEGTVDADSYSNVTVTVGSNVIWKGTMDADNDALSSTVTVNSDGSWSLTGDSYVDVLVNNGTIYKCGYNLTYGSLSGNGTISEGEGIGENYLDNQMNDGRVYSIEGRCLGNEVPENYRGVYIQNGKKFVKTK